MLLLTALLLFMFSFLMLPTQQYPHYFFNFILANIDCKTIKKQSNADNTILTHQLDSVPWVVIKLDMEPLINTPNSVPNGVPTPPLSRVPPITADEMASISSPFACSTNPAQLLRQKRNPPMPAKSPFNIYAHSLVLRTLIPIIRALC